MLYLASPYSHPDKAVEQQRYDLVLETFANLCITGHVVYCPIAACHEATVRFKLRGDAEYWSKVNTKFICLCDEVWVLCIPGWAKSRGVMAEIQLARQLFIPIRYIDTSCIFLNPKELPA